MVLRPPAASAVVHRHYQVGSRGYASGPARWVRAGRNRLNCREIGTWLPFLSMTRPVRTCPWLQRGAIATLELRGALFFGSSLKILDEVKAVLNGSSNGSVPPSQGDAAAAAAAATAVAAAAAATAASQAARSAMSGYFLVPSPPPDGGASGAPPPPPPLASPKTPRGFGEGEPGTWNSYVMVR